MTNLPDDQTDPQTAQTEEVPPGAPVPGESAPLSGETAEPPQPTSRQHDEDEAANPQGAVVSEGKDS